MNNTLSLEKYKKQIYMYLALFVTISSLFAVGYVFSFIPNILDTQFIQANYIKSLENFVAEKSESVQYMGLTLLFPMFFVVLFNIIKKIPIKDKYCKLIYNILFFITFILFFILSFIIIKNKHALLYITTLKGNLILFILFCLVVLFTLLFYKFFNKKNFIKYCSYFIGGVYILLLSYLYINSSFAQNPFIAHHTDAYYYPILKITSGLTPYIDFNPLYGCYSYFFSFIQTIFNNNSLLSFSIIIAGLVCITLCNFFIVINKLIKNKIISLLTFFALTFYMIIVSFVCNSAPYLQYMPHRVISLSVLLLYITIYLKYRIKFNKTILQLIGFFICSLALFWNVETGLISLVVWLGFLIYEILFYNSLKSFKTYLYILKTIIFAILSVFFTLLIINIIGYIRTGELTSINSIVSSQTLFYGTGFFMARMSLWKPWMILITVYLIGLAVSMRKLYLLNGNKQLLFNKYAMIFTISILGLGIFSYYQGRSYDTVLFSVLYPGFILLGIFADLLLRKIHIIKTLYAKIINIIVLLSILISLIICSFAALSNLYYNDNLHLYLNKTRLNDLNILVDLPIPDENNTDFICIYESLFYKKYNLLDTKIFPAHCDIFTYKDCEKILNYLLNTKKSVIIDKDLYSIIENNYPDSIKNINTIFNLETCSEYFLLTPLNKI